jgi:hypothetical protein
MQTNNSKPTPRVNEDAERFDEITGGYSDYEHDRAAKRIMADLRKMEAAPRMRANFKHSCGTEGVIHHRDGDVFTATLTINAHGGAERIGHLYASAPDLLAACQRVLRAIEWGTTADRMDSAEQAELLRAAIARATNGGGM